MKCPGPAAACMSDVNPTSKAQEFPIAAIATAIGSAGLCVIRVSGTGALEIGDRLVGPSARKPSQQKTGTFCYAKIMHPDTGKRVDDVILLVFRAPHSYTGEDTIEIQGHGGAVCSRNLLHAVLAAGARLADPGEFTKRAFLNGRMDLTQAEAVCDLIQSKTDRAARVARDQLDGLLGKTIDALYLRVTELCADVEHLLDFDESDLQVSFEGPFRQTIRRLSAELEILIHSWHENHFLRDGAVVVISGRPNAGKSSLMNALLGRNRAIVHADPGTTRDMIEDVFSIAGIPVRLIDTAGLRPTDNAIEREGIERAHRAMEQADLNLYLIDQSAGVSADDLTALKTLSRINTIVILTKDDLPGPFDLRVPGDFETVRISSVKRSGFENLVEKMLATLGASDGPSERPVVSVRHVEELRLTLRCLQTTDGLLAAGRGDDLVIVANRLREAAEALGRIVGRIYSDDLLDAIFGKFCVGK